VVGVGGITSVPETNRPKKELEGDRRQETYALFADQLRRALDKVNDQVREADLMAQKVVTGESENLHQVMIALEKAALAVNLTVEVRNRVVEAYQEIMRMQV